MIFTRIKRGAIRSKTLIKQKFDLKYRASVQRIIRLSRSLASVSLAAHVVLAPAPFHLGATQALAAGEEQPPSIVQQDAAASLQTLKFSSNGLYLDTETKLSPIVAGQSNADLQKQQEEAAAAAQAQAELQRKQQQLAQVRLLGSVTVDSSANQDVVRQAAQSHFADQSQVQCTEWIVTHESGFRNTAQNWSSGAYGLFQFLNSTWRGTGIGKTSDPALQAEAGMRYIQNRYGTPCQAKAYWMAHGSY